MLEIDYFNASTGLHFAFQEIVIVKIRFACHFTFKKIIVNRKSRKIEATEWKLFNLGVCRKGIYWVLRLALKGFSWFHSNFFRFLIFHVSSNSSIKFSTQNCPFSVFPLSFTKLHSKSHSNVSMILVCPSKCQEKVKLHAPTPLIISTHSSPPPV